MLLFTKKATINCISGTAIAVYYLYCQLLSLLRSGYQCSIFSVVYHLVKKERGESEKEFDLGSSIVTSR